MAEPHLLKCRSFAERLERLGFSQKIHEFPGFCVVDYGDPLIEEAIEKEYPLMERVSDYAYFSSRGSFTFREDGSGKGEVPISVARPKDAIGFEREEIRPPARCKFKEVHLHVWDHNGAIHFHVDCEDAEPRILAEFIKEARETARKFLKY